MSTFVSVLFWMVTYKNYGGFPWIGMLLEGGLHPVSILLWLLIHALTWGIMAWNANMLVEMTR